MNKYKLLGIQTFGHFCVDATCAAVVFSSTSNIVSVLAFFMFYNFLAFCLQPLAGIILDKAPQIQPKHYILISFALLLLGLVPEPFVIARIILVGLGNCLFHVGAGMLILDQSNHKLTPLGVFVSSGAVGLLLGALFAMSPITHVLLALFLGVLFLLNMDLTFIEKKTKKLPVYWCSAGLLSVCILIRSFMGFVSLTDFEKTPLILFIITMGVFFGKCTGGILCDFFGIKKVVLMSTACVTGLFLFSFHNPYLWTLVQVVVNLSMPITLYLMYRSLPHYPAFSFGFAAAFLVVGLMGALLVQGITIPPACFLILFVINSSIILYVERKIK